MKTRMQWFIDLPIHMSLKAIVNTKMVSLDLEQDNMTEAIMGAFCWEETPEGKGYWRDIYDAYSKLETTLESIKEETYA